METLRKAIISCLLLVAWASTAQGRTIALVVSISGYENWQPLPSATTDAQKIFSLLKSRGINADIWSDARDSFQGKQGRSIWDKKWKGFVGNISGGDDVLIFILAHGVAAGPNIRYFVLPHASITTGTGWVPTAGSDFVQIDSLMNSLHARRPRSLAVVIDTCADNGLNIGKPVAEAKGPFPQQLILYAASQGEEAGLLPPREKPDGSILIGSLLTAAKNARNDDLLLVFQRAQQEVENKARLVTLHHKDQHPEIQGVLSIPICLGKCRTGGSIAGKSAPDYIGKTLVVPTSGETFATIREKLRLNGVEIDKSNAVFIGRQSLLRSCQRSDRYSHPFGCDILLGISDYWNSARMSFTLTSLLDITVYANIASSGNGFTVTCAISTVKTGTQLDFSGFLSLHAGGDVFYWGLLSGDTFSCRPSP